MSRTPSLRRRLLVAFVGAMLLLKAMGAAVRAESYGELGHFGKGAGTDPGQFQIPTEKVETHAFGVDPTKERIYALAVTLVL